MSWDGYITSLTGSGHIDKAAIYENTGYSKWASSAGFEISEAEIKEVIGAYADPSKVRAEGLHVAGQRFVVLKADERSVYGKSGKEGIIIVKTERALVMGHYPENVIAGTATATVERMGDYLIGVGY